MGVKNKKSRLKKEILSFGCLGGNMRVRSKVVRGEECLRLEWKGVWGGRGKGEGGRGKKGDWLDKGKSKARARTGQAGGA